MAAQTSLSAWTTAAARTSQVGGALPGPDNGWVTPLPDDSATLASPPVVEPIPPVEAADRPGWRRETIIFLTSQTISLFGSSLVQFAIMWHLTLQTRSGSVMALAAVFGFLPQAVVSIFGGVWADRLNRKMHLEALKLADGVAEVQLMPADGSDSETFVSW